MRKSALVIGLFLVSLFFPLQKTLAGCNPGLQTPGGGSVTCSGTTVACVTGPITVQCCDLITECPTGSVPEGASQTFTLCDGVPTGANRDDCTKCVGEGTGVWTAIGCIKFGSDPNNLDPTDFLGNMITLGVGAAGGIAFLLILFGGLQIMTSAGNPEQLNAGRELISAAVIGLILVIFSIFILKFIGFNMLGIRGFDGVQP